jgi:hypothetical protein
LIEVVVALIAALVYIAISLVVGDRFPFSRYAMYADLTRRREGAVLYIRADDRFIAPDDLDAVHGIDVAALNTRGVPCSQEWLVHEAKRWLSTHLVENAPEQAVPVEIGWRMLRVDDGTVHERLEPVTHGTGRLRR